MVSKSSDFPQEFQFPEFLAQPPGDSFGDFAADIPWSITVLLLYYVDSVQTMANRQGSEKRD